MKFILQNEDALKLARVQSLKAAKIEFFQQYIGLVYVLSRKTVQVKVLLMNAKFVEHTLIHNGLESVVGSVKLINHNVKLTQIAKITNFVKLENALKNLKNVEIMFALSMSNAHMENAISPINAQISFVNFTSSVTVKVNARTSAHL